MSALLAVPAIRNGLIGLAALAAIWAGVAWLQHAAYKRGTADMKSAITRQDDKAAGAAKAAADTVDGCYDAGREWDVTRGVCGE